jgi:hypothetical protein
MYLSFHRMAQCAVHVLNGLACHARIRLACLLTLQAVLSAHVAFAPRAAAPVLLAHAEVTKTQYFFVVSCG